MSWYLTASVFIPLLGALVLLFWNKDDHKGVRTIATLTTGVVLLLAFVMLFAFDYGNSGQYQFVDRVNWIPSLGVSYYLGVDGLSFSMVLLSALVFFLACLASYNITDRVKDYFVLYLLLQTGTVGVFVALDFVLFYVFWELVLLPMYFLIGIWGGARREYAAIKFFIYTLVGSVVMLVAALALYFKTGVGSFAIPDIVAAAQKAGIQADTFGILVFLGLFVGFAVKVPVFPFHTWLPDAHVEAPTPISMILAGLLLKLGSYAMVRIGHPAMPDVAQWFVPGLLILAFFNIIWGALTAMAQKDFKRMVAYSSINHMGYFLLGLAAGTPAALQGGWFVTVSHGLISALFFFVVGMFYERTHTRDMTRMSGMWRTIPVISTVAAFTAFANLGLPGLSGFIGEFFALMGGYQTFGMWVLLATIGLVVTAAFHLIMMRNMLMGDPSKEWQGLPDITQREALTFAPLGALIIFFGVYPTPVFNLVNPTISALSKLLMGG